MRRWSSRAAVALAALFLIAALGFVAWASSVNDILPEAQAALQSDAGVRVTQGEWLVFEPSSAEPDVGLVFYPGGRVDPRAYAPTMRALAENGYLAVVVPMPLNLAVLGAERAAYVMASYPSIERWAVGGHSLGAAMAAAYGDRHPEAVDGVVLYAGYPAQSNSLAEDDVKVVSIYGTRDGLASAAEVEASQALLPPDTRFVAIEGGNHAQFGYYGAQRGDNQATLTRAEQQAQVVEATLSLLSQLEDIETSFRETIYTAARATYTICTAFEKL